MRSWRNIVLLISVLATMDCNCAVMAFSGSPSLLPTFLSRPSFGGTLSSNEYAKRLSPIQAMRIIVLGDDEDGGNQEDQEDDEDDEPETEDPYTKLASSEFEGDGDPQKMSSALVTQDDLATMMDWGGALGKLRQRVGDIESGLSKDPSHALFRMLSSQTPNQIIGQFVSSANPQVVQAMSGAVSSLLGGLSNPNMGMETIVKASGDKIGSLCFQLQMTGYMFRNAEYVLALKDLLNLQGKADIDDYREAFDRLDTNGSGYIEVSEIQKLFDDVYEGKAPAFEINAFMEFFDENNDGKISWGEFERGLGAAVATSVTKQGAAMRLLEDSMVEGEVEDDDEDIVDIDSTVSGTIQIEMEDGNIVEVDAKEYMEDLKKEARSLKDALKREKFGRSSGGVNGTVNGGLMPNGGPSSGMDVAGYIASRQGDVKALTEGISPEIVETMKKLVSYVLEGGDSGKAKTELTDREKAEMEMEIPGSALQQLALWQLVLGYRLRESEVKGEYLKLLE